VRHLDVGEWSEPEFYEAAQVLNARRTGTKEAALFERPRSPTTKGDCCNSRYLVTGWPFVLIFRDANE